MTYYNDIEIFKRLGKIDRKYEYDSNIKESVSYLNIPISFDIETTSYYLNGDKMAFMYEWSFAIKDIVVYGRTWEEFIELLHSLRLWYSLSLTDRMIIYIHNFSFEFQFMRKYLEWLWVFAVDDRKPIKALCSYGIEFRDSYILSGYSLEKTADNLVNHSIKKLVGDLDYSLIRHYATDLSEQELAYCENDVLIITAYIEEQIEQNDNNITKIPLTNTGRVRRFVRQNCLRDRKRKVSGKGVGKRYRQLMEELKLDLRSYIFCKKAFQGGFTHASNLYSGELLENIHSIDFNSSYPFAMVSEKYPMSRPYELTDRDMVYSNDNYCYLIRIKIKGLHSKLTYESYLSESKVKGENILSVNGRVFSANSIETIVTDIDFKIIQEVYDYKKLEIIDGYYFYKQYLPRAIIDSILTLYENKTNLKGVQGKEVEYLLSKGMLNSVYGMCVTNIIRDSNVYEYGEWLHTRLSELEMIDTIARNNDSKNRFLYYPWGVWVTAYARYNLWQGIINFADDYVYSDTDSIKFMNYEKHKEYIEIYNRSCEDKLRKMTDFRKLDFDRCRPQGRMLGVFDYEGVSEFFKTLGAKRYLTYNNGKYKMTVAGLSKQNGMQYLQEIGDNDIQKVFELFNDGLIIPSDRTGKNTHIYIDDVKEGYVTDYRGVTEWVIAKSGVHLEKASFEMGMNDKYISFLKMLKEGYILSRGYV